MSKFLSTSAVALASVFFANYASATDLKGDPTSATYQEPKAGWTGLYLSAFGGWVWSGLEGPLSYDDAYKYEKFLDFDGSERKLDAENWFAGVGIGGDHQFGRIVAGVVVDAAISDLSADGSFLPYPDAKGSPSWNVKTEIEYFGTARGRLGYLLQDNILVYATGGLAWAMVESSVSPVYGEGEKAFVNGKATASNNHIGWVAGGGVEWKLTNNLSLSGEYLYFDLGEQDYRHSGSDAFGNTYATDNFHPDLDLHVVKAGLNYRF